MSDDPLFVVANEFFDALPIKQFVKADDGWHERLVGLMDGHRAFGLSPTPIPEGAAPPEVQACGEPARSWNYQPRPSIPCSGSPARSRLQGGALLAIDYGYAGTQTGETLQAVKDPRLRRSPRRAGGDRSFRPCQLRHVLAEAAKSAGLAVAPLATQGEFLLRLGLGERAKALARANPAEAANIARAVERLTAPTQMGTLFKALCAHSPGLKPAGF